MKHKNVRKVSVGQDMIVNVTNKSSVGTGNNELMQLLSIPVDYSSDSKERGLLNACMHREKFTFCVFLCRSIL